MFIVLEGIDGCGKTTQSDRIESWLAGRLGPSAVVRTFEPGGWDGGERIRAMLLESAFRGELSEFFLFMLDRCEHVSRVIAPALRAGRVVLSDRYTPSTLAYQILGNPGLTKETKDCIAELPHRLGWPEPDIVLLLDIGVDVAEARISGRGKRDAFDARGRAYFEQVREGYDRLMQAATRSKWVRVDASRGPDEVTDELKRLLEPMLPEVTG